MTPNEEIRVLTWLLRRASMTSERVQALFTRIRVGMWIALVVLFVVLFGFAQSGHVAITIVGFAYFAIGASGLLLAYVSSLKQWSAIIPHVNRESVELRLDDLKPNKSLERTREE